MKVSELRLGNLVKINDRGCDCIYRVTGISETDIDAQCINRCDPFKEVYNEPIENLSPTLLTKEWLLKFGFSSTLYKELDNGWICISGKSLDIGGAAACTQSMMWSAPCEYVHQLQNLYFALTGEELTLTYAT